METSTVTSPPLSTEQQVIRLRRLQTEGRDEEALAGASRLLEAFPENRDVLLIAATAERRLGRTADAKARLSRLETLQPRFSLMHQEWGLCYVGERDAPNAIDRLLRAVNLNPALPASWKMLIRLYQYDGR